MNLLSRSTFLATTKSSPPDPYLNTTLDTLFCMGRRITMNSSQCNQEPLLKIILIYTTTITFNDTTESTHPKVPTVINMNVDGLRSGGRGTCDGEGLGLVPVLIPRLPEGLSGSIG